MKHKRKHGNGGGSSWIRPGRLRLAVAGVLLALAAARPAAAQQAPAAVAGAALPEKSYMTKNAFYLPVSIDDRARVGMREIQLWVKEGDRGWELKERASSAQTGFPYRLSQDGEYWFSVVTIDNVGKATPADVRNEQPGVIVVLDTVGPQVDLKPLPHSAEGICLRCDVHDANPNPYSTKLEYQTGDHVWRQCEPMADQAECFCIPRQAVLTGMVKITCTDRAANTTVREFNLVNMLMPAANTSAAPAEQVVVRTAHAEPASETPAQQSLYPPLAPTPDSNKPVRVVPGELKLVPAEVPPLPAEAVTVAAQVPVYQDLNQKPKAGAKWHMVRDPHISLEYRIEDVGRSGVGKVEVWITKDGGRSWEVLCEDADRKSPVEFCLPGEGIFGIRLAVSNGRGFGAEPPRPGDAPEFVVELDGTKPHVELLTVKLGPPNESACIEINWLAFDNNFGPDPIDLYYAINPLGPWTPIAKGVANTGKYRWFLPQQIGRQAYVRVVAKDLAGNVNHCDLNEAVALDDMSRPTAHIVMPLSPAGNTPPTGN